MEKQWKGIRIIQEIFDNTKIEIRRKKRHRISKNGRMEDKGFSNGTAQLWCNSENEKVMRKDKAEQFFFKLIKSCWILKMFKFC